MINSYATGATQYGGTSAANKGMTLDPTGYMQRESDRRSKLAQNAMAQRTAPQASSYSASSPLNFETRSPTGRILPAPTTEFQAPPAPNIAAPAGVSPDETYNSQAYQASADYQAQARALMQQRQLAELDYTKQARGLQETLDQIPGQVRDASARSGLLRSSFFGKTLDDALRGAGNEVSGALENRNFADQAYTSGLTDLSGGYSNIMALAAQNLSSRMAEKAGKLGLGTPENTPLTESNIGQMIQDILNKQSGTSNPIAGTPPAISNPQPTQPAGSRAVPSGGTYASGARGDAVKQIQSIVGVNPDGIFGPKTQAAVKAWQQQHGLVADGVVGPKTLAAMRG